MIKGLLTRDFYHQCTIDVARGLLGQILVRELPNGKRLSGRIVETEAYLGIEDPAAHSFKGSTPRSAVMFGPAGFSYIYFIYGMYHCFNVVTMPEGIGEAVLIRALEVVDGEEEMQKYRQRNGLPKVAAEKLANGPGKLCQALQLTKAQNALDLCVKKEVWIEENFLHSTKEVCEGPRVGIGDKHDAVYWPLRFGFKSHPSLSLTRFPNYQE